jgi:hypothetical protein
MRSDKAIVATAIIAAAVFMLAAPLITTTPKQAYAQNGKGLIVPLYGWDAGWSQVIQAKQNHPGTQIFAVVNPAAGPGSGPDSHYLSVINDMKNAGVVVLGYVTSSYGGAGLSMLENQIRSYHDWYGVNGIFIDEVSPGSLSYYQTLHDYAHGVGAQQVVLNPGAPVPASYAGAGDIIVAYENGYIPSQVSSNGITTSKLGALIHGVTPSRDQFENLLNQVGYVYMSPDWSHAAPNIVDQASWC